MRGEVKKTDENHSENFLASLIKKKNKKKMNKTKHNISLVL